MRKEPLRRGDLRGDALDLRFLIRADLARRDADEPLPLLVAGDEPAPVIGREADPRAEFALRHREELLDLEAGKTWNVLAGNRDVPCASGVPGKTLPHG